MRILMVPAVGAALLSAFGLYAVNQDTRQLAEANQDAAREIETLKRDIAILRAEKAYLMRPERLEPLARKLGMRPIEGRQFISVGDLPVSKVKGR